MKCNGCKWWTKRLALAVDGRLLAWCLNPKSPTCNRMVCDGCDSGEAAAVDSAMEAMGFDKAEAKEESDV